LLGLLLVVADTGAARLIKDPQLRVEVQAKLELGWWGLEQTAAHLRRTYPDQQGWHVCHEMIH